MAAPTTEWREALESIAEWTFARSAGPGGQNVNKVNTKVLLRIPLDRLEIFDEPEKALVREKLSSRIVEDALMIQVQDQRTQLKNRELALDRAIVLLEKALHREKARRATKPTRASKVRRMEAKRIASNRKSGRSGNFSED